MSDFWTLDSQMPPGQLVDVGGYRLHQYSLGQDSPTVLLFAGEFGWSLDWRYIQPMIAEYSRVCSFDRAGMGWSDPAPSHRRLLNIINEIQILLERSDFLGPYILVGYGFGSHLTRIFANLFPEEVLGMVLIKPRDEQFPVSLSPGWQSADRKRARKIRTQHILAQLGLLSLAVKIVGNRFEPRDGQDLPAYIRAMYMEPSYFAAIMADRACQAENDRLVSQTQIPKTIPLVVISSITPGWLPEYFAEDREQADDFWQASQERFLQMSTKSTLITFEGDEEAVLMEHPAIVNEAIRGMMAGMQQ